MFDPITMIWWVTASIILSFVLGRLSVSKDRIIEYTMMYLVENGYLQYQYMKDGELDIMKLNETDSDGSVYNA